jgi:hypothetical protein
MPTEPNPQDASIDLLFDLLNLIEKYGKHVVSAMVARLCATSRRGHPEEPGDELRLQKVYTLMHESHFTGMKRLTLNAAATLVSADDWTHSPEATAQRLRRKHRAIQQRERRRGRSMVAALQGEPYSDLFFGLTRPSPRRGSGKSCSE